MQDLEFKPIDITSKDEILQVTLKTTCQNCDLNFMNLYSWCFLYRTEYAKWNSMVFFRFYVDDHLAYMLPGQEGDLHGVIHIMMEDSEKHDRPFLLMGVCEKCKGILDQEFPDFFSYAADRRYADYIYERDALATLAGKKLQAKRNHANRFERLFPTYEYRPLTADLIPLCLELEKKWMEEKEENQGGIQYETERKSMENVFEQWEKLGGIGGTIFIENQLVAFTFGAPINANTFDVCVEKADTTVEGAFTVINRDFVRHLPEQYQYINREEDLGVEGLRHAKLSYKPSILLNKYRVILKHPFSHVAE